MKATQQLVPEHPANTATTIQNRSGADVPADETISKTADGPSTLDNVDANPENTDILLDVLLDEASVFNFWDTWTRL